jgi:YcaO-like protein with predicted kinase domain
VTEADCNLPADFACRPPFEDPAEIQAHGALGSALNAALALAPAAGITRIADITGLDIIGVPVVSVFRPNARSLSVSSGKGSTHIEACVSGIMEALELFHAETFAEWRFLGDLDRSIVTPDLDHLPRLRDANDDRCDRQSIRMTIGTELVFNRRAAIPFDLVHADFRPRQIERGDGFLFSTTGLAGGLSREDALLHALCEVIESDAVALVGACDPSYSMAGRSPIDWSTVTDEIALSMHERCRKQSIAVHAFDITSDTGVPVFYCRLMDGLMAGARIRPATDGSACHPSPTIALLRALAEAIQIRLVLIAGSRDDLRNRDYLKNAPPFSKEIGSRFDSSRGISGNPSSSACLGWVCDRLAEAGFKNVIAVDLNSRSEPLSFVRVVVPGLEAYPHSRKYQPGRRALAARETA